MRAILTKGPIVGVIHIGNDWNTFPYSGNQIYEPINGFPSDSENDIKYHLMTIMGWGQLENGKKYWIVENSYGETYNLDTDGSFTDKNYSKGFFRIGRRNELINGNSVDSAIGDLPIYFSDVGISDNGINRYIDFDKDKAICKINDPSCTTDGFIEWKYKKINNNATGNYFEPDKFGDVSDFEIFSTS